MDEYIDYLSQLIPEKDSLKIVKTESKKFYKERTSHDCYKMYPALWQSDNFQIQEVGVFLAGYIADEYSECLDFLHDTVSQHENWKVQEILAASEGLRVWTSRPFFKEHPQIAIDLLASHREDESEYVRKSAGNALRDISKKFPQLVAEELNSWDLSSKKTMQVYKLASRFIKGE